MRYEEFELACLIAKIFVEAKQLVVRQRISDRKLPDLGPVDGELGLILIRDLKLRTDSDWLRRELFYTMAEHSLW